MPHRRGCRRRVPGHRRKPGRPIGGFITQTTSKAASARSGRRAALRPRLPEDDGFWASSAKSVTLTFYNIPTHGGLRVSFDLFIIGSWDGNYVSPSAGPDIWDFSPQTGLPVLHTTFNTHTFAAQYQAYPDEYPGGQYPSNTGAVEVDTLGYSCSGSCTNAVYHVNLTFEHRANPMVLVFSGIGLESVANESWGLDNVTVWVASPPPGFRQRRRH